MEQIIAEALSVQSSDMDDSSGTASIHSSYFEEEDTGEENVEEENAEEEDIGEEDDEEHVEEDVEGDDPDSLDEDSSDDDDDDRSQTSSQAYFDADDHFGRIDYMIYKHAPRPDWLKKIANEQTSDAEKKKHARTPFTQRFADLVQSLPLELYNKILQLTFSTTPGEIFVECEDEEYSYVPPAILQVDRTTRAYAAKSYYNNTSFVIAVRIWRHWAYGDDDSDELENAGFYWLDSLSMQHRWELREVRVVCCNKQYGEADVSYAFDDEDFGLDIDWDEDIEEENDEDMRWVVTVGLNGHAPTKCFPDGNEHCKRY